MTIRLFSLTAWFLALLSPALGYAEENDWWRELQVYGMVPLPVEVMKAKYRTVAGLAAGIGAASPVRMLETLAAYPDDETFVKAVHKARMKVSCYVAGCAGRPAVMMEYPDVAEARCESFFGGPCKWGSEADQIGFGYYMCSNNPVWPRFQIEYGKRGIDLGADVIFFDEIQGSTLALWPGFQRPGFCSHCLQAFRDYLRRKHSKDELKDELGIDDVSTFDFREWLKNEDLVKGLEDVSLESEIKMRSHPLVQTYFDFQMEANYRSKSKVIQAWREHAKSKGRTLAVTSNVAELNVGGVWPMAITGLELSEQLDFFACEIMHALGSSDSDSPYWPKGKWAGFYRLAQGILDTRPVLMPGAQHAGVIVGSNESGVPLDNLYMGMFMEGYSLNGAFVDYQVTVHPDSPDGIGPLYRKTAGAAKYASENSDLFQGLKPLAETAIYLQYRPEAQKYGHSYLGLAQALAESKVDFETLVQGDGRYIKRKVSLEDLSSYKVVYVVALSDTPEWEKRLLLDYVKGGGALVINDSAELGVAGEQGAHPMGEGFVIVFHRQKRGPFEIDPSWQYFQSYDDGLRELLMAPVRRFVGRPIRISPDSRRVIAYGYHQPEKNRLVYHLVNYDYAQATDTIHEKENLIMTIQPSPPIKPIAGAELRGLDYPESVNIPGKETQGEFRFNLPRLKCHATLVVPLAD